MWHTMRRTSRLCAKEFFHIKRCSTIKQSVRSLSTPNATSKESSLPPALGQHHDIYLSTSSDPYFNLTLEDWLFRHARPEDPLLLIYRDSPCVVIGRNQNPWTEVNFSALRSVGIPFIRRRSGGGTVYHDLGNTNFSIHLPRTSFDRHATGRLVLGAVRALGIDARLNDRNDICVGTEKISSAYKIVNNRAYHHGTMLISTKLGTLGDVLRPQLESGSIVTKGVGSVRSPVCNLQAYEPNVSHERLSSAVVEQFRKEFGVTSKPCIVHDSEDIKSIEYIRKGMAELSTWDWMFGQTPEFTHTLEREFPWGKVDIEIHSRHGVILDCVMKFEGPTDLDPDLNAFSKLCLEGKRYGFLGAVSAEDSAKWTQPQHELYSWLRTATNVDFLI